MLSPPPQLLRLPSKRNVLSSWSRRPPATGRCAQGNCYRSFLEKHITVHQNSVKTLAAPSGTALAISVFRPEAKQGYRYDYMVTPAFFTYGFSEQVKDLDNLSSKPRGPQELTPSITAWKMQSSSKMGKIAVALLQTCNCCSPSSIVFLLRSLGSLKLIGNITLLFPKAQGKRTNGGPAYRSRDDGDLSLP
ncbi:hypothetical protein OPV22_006357 [Ensete ventricosum]|uniref:Uncharacterized protein n=1 Tax=Ensete ventricosum TaxID=4639 RepID=A0AAV8RRK8_ENSVE|nr:hypothetical protein OPV22_006357 [Ensete ventricosum]